ncbi:Lrp/AsnC family transcriptional regulator [Falsiroseomonas selenitidurans]|uniref:Lrp/AsnC family transcriptional regulator n=1 Tax=Falsiroseomonas selenitidurans TaxID=2716335 RepID=A0ABX1E3H9_9PROT|nr:Lrp/AsnC family transcriptional regulator [Falsiroseomonas selenitidurans]NKC31742.1 Lrp/AsnC family transcriptional regulator [Falsiroseomonas selenitidurans]OYW08388.1 MAG: AsnC family transcriptional regulator [Rhodospirillales bacterium 12-71-4]
MDEIDRNLVVALQENGAAGLAELSKVAGLSVSATAERVKRLEERAVIRGWRIDLDPIAAGCPLLAFVFVAMRPGASDAGFADAMRGHEAVLECHTVTGAWCFLLKLRLADIAALEDFVSTKVRAQPGVERTETILALASPKETAILPVAEAEEE